MTYALTSPVLTVYEELKDFPGKLKNFSKELKDFPLELKDFLGELKRFGDAEEVCVLLKDFLG